MVPDVVSDGSGTTTVLEPGETGELAQPVDLARAVPLSGDRRRQHEAALPDHVDTLLGVITRSARRLLNLDVAYVSLNRPDGSAYICASEGETTALAVGRDAAGGPSMGSLAQESQLPVWSADYLNDETVPHSPAFDDVVRAEGLHAVIAVPLCHGESAFGALHGARREAHHFSPGEVDVLTCLADLAMADIERASLLGQIRDEFAEPEHEKSRTRATLTRVRYLWEAHARLGGLVLDGAGLQTVARAAADALDGVLEVRDPGGRPLTAVVELPGVDEEAVTKAAFEAHTNRRPVGLPGDIWVSPMTAGAEDLGVIVLRAAATLTGEDLRLLHLAAQSIATLLLLQRGTAAAEGPMHDELLHDLLNGPHRSEVHLSERARRLGIDVEAPHVVVVARPEGGDLGKAVAWASSYAYRMAGLKGVCRGCIVFLLPGADASVAGRTVSGGLSPLLGHPVSIGAAGPANSAVSVARVYEEAVRCLDALTALGGTGSTASLQELGFLGLLLSADHDVDTFIRSTIGPVLDYDTSRLTDLAKTLEAYFESGGSPTHAAEALHVHPNTVARRLERITDLLGPQWQKPGPVLEVQMALRLRKTRGVLNEMRRTSGQLKEPRRSKGPEPTGTAG
ncbi:helix-turn-helix domain-containing protein [Streptomyces sp. A3M-1-3]|uniref:helix-turn-helix domain-containing protein n=1 Tax=Streptomyces sp. A3M-1-3 TaxID=2962044 RepID=UPI0020B8D2ED|nr:helix-turn-helix domain-containing protein [Streptomyces sp. A3M-1-3]MCP3822823.1 helix-turn-helix domain-containing protein [Streptomyces sp. A3M-1-3]